MKYSHLVTVQLSSKDIVQKTFTSEEEILTEEEWNNFANTTFEGEKWVVLNVVTIKI